MGPRVNTVTSSSTKCLYVEVRKHPMTEITAHLSTALAEDLKHQRKVAVRALRNEGYSPC